MSLFKIIKQRRVTLQITQADLAEMAEVSLATIKDIERGKSNPSLKTIEKIIDTLGLEMTFRLRGSNNIYSPANIKS